MTIMIIATACTPIINIGHSSDGYAYHRRGASQRRSDEKERPRQDCRTRSRAPLRAALLRVRRSSHWAAGTLACVFVAVPSPCAAPGHGPTDCLRQGVRIWCWPRRGRRSDTAGPPRPIRSAIMTNRPVACLSLQSAAQRGGLRGHFRLDEPVRGTAAPNADTCGKPGPAQHRNYQPCDQLQESQRDW